MLWNIKTEHGSTVDLSHIELVSQGESGDEDQKCKVSRGTYLLTHPDDVRMGQQIRPPTHPDSNSVKVEVW